MSQLHHFNVEPVPSDLVQDELDRNGIYIEAEGLADWDQSHGDHPRSWGRWRKLYTTSFVLWAEFFMTFISASGTTAATESHVHYGISKTVAYFAFISTYLIAQGLGGIVVTPISESYGRRALYLFALIVFTVFNVIIAGSDSLVAVFFGRFMTGLVASIPATVAYGQFEDMYDAEMRIWIVYLFTLFANAGLVLGPIYAAYISSTLGWRWIFYIATIVAGVLALLTFGLSESRVTTLLQRKVEAVNKATGSDFKTSSMDQHLTVNKFLTTRVYRPLFFLFTEPLVMFSSAVCSIGFALFYAETESLTIVYESFGFSSRGSSLSFIAVLLGLVLDVIPRFYEQRIYDKHRREGAPLTPELKIGSFAVACPALAIGLWIFAWTIPPLVLHLHWIPSMIGLVLTGFAENDFAVVLFGYLTDSYGANAASAVAALSLSRTIAAAVLPLFITQMYTSLGSNIATSIIAAIATLFCFTPFFFIRYGGRMRKKSQWAATLEHEEDTSSIGHDTEKGLSGQRTNGKVEGDAKERPVKEQEMEKTAQSVTQSRGRPIVYTLDQRQCCTM